jgi:hypothetical protein
MKLSLVVLLVASLLSPFAGAADSLENIPLTWKPTEPVKMPSGLSNIVDRVTLDEFTDTRKTGGLIAENRERADKVLRVTTPDNVAAFVARNFRRSLEQAGINVAASGTDRRIGGEVRQFFVTETDAYRSEVVVKVWIKDARGQELWNSVITGRTTRKGRSYKADNYYEVLSDALGSVITTFLENADARKALTK